MPIWAALAPSARAAATPRPSMIPPAAITGRSTAASTVATSGQGPDQARLDLGQEVAAMAAGLDALGADPVGAGLGPGPRLGDRVGRADDIAAGRLQGLDLLAG